jgi:hypothetical protein
MVTRIGAYGAILVLLLGIAPPTLRAHLATDVRPVLDCVEKVGDDGFVAFFGYESRSSETVTIRVGDDNHFAPGPADQAQPEDFLPGRHRSVISVPLSGVGELGWTLNDVTATASAASKRCRRSSDLIVLPAAHNGAVMGRDGYAIRFDHVDFGHEPGFFKSFSALMATPNPGNHVELWVDAPNKSMGGRMIADLRTHARDAGPGVGSGFEVFRFQSTPLVFSPIGIHNVFIVFNGHENREARVNGGGSGIGKFKEFDISPLSISPPKPGSLLAVDYDLQSGISLSS